MMRQLFFFFLWGLFVYLLWKVLFPDTRHSHNGGAPDGKMEVMVHDPNCNTFIPRPEALPKKIGGKTFYFCSRKCMKEFRARTRKGTPPTQQT